MQAKKIDKYDIEAKQYTGIIRGARTCIGSKAGVEQEYVRLVIEITSDTHPIYNLMAGKNYYESHTEELLVDFYRILDSGVAGLICDGQIVVDKLQLVVGKEVQFEVRHAVTNKHAKPYCNVGPLAPVLMVA